MFFRLSYDLSPDAPGWPGMPKLETRRAMSIDRGDVANLTELTLCPHFGTHLDTPLHFTEHGPAVTDLPVEAFIYEKHDLIDHPKGAGRLITAGEIRGRLPAPNG